MGSEGPDEVVVTVKVREHGPYKVTGPIRLVDHDGEPIDVPVGDAVILCRCGASKTKPFCDRSHREIAFEG